ncbi:protein lin-52 homolog [Arctopsyche grandis]|uniref:protein lin-52 homolog n=1 Tax=Arctopsyche grandis TaxID=121162 RepID=UPI00406D81D0
MAGSTGGANRIRTGEGEGDGGSGSGSGSGSTAQPEDSLLSMETMDRTSPDLWPQHIPGLGDFVTLRSESAGLDKKPAPSWSKLNTAADIRLMHQLSTLSTSSLIIEVKKLHDLAYQLGIEEAKEMTRGKYLNIFKSRCNR